MMPESRDQFGRIEQRLDDMGGAIDVLTKDVRVLKDDVKGLKEDVRGLKEDAGSAGLRAARRREP
jgi:hypothetical protein